MLYAIVFLLLLVDVPNEKMHVLVFSEKEWCAPCLKMDKEVWPDKEVQEEINKRAIHTKMTQGDYSNWKVKSIPTIIIAEEIDGIGLVERRRNIGFIDKIKLLEFLRR